MLVFSSNSSFVETFKNYVFIWALKLSKLIKDKFSRKDPTLLPRKPLPKPKDKIYNPDEENEKEDEKEDENKKENENEKNNDRNKTKTNDTEPGTNKNESKQTKGKKKNKSNLWIIILCIIGGIILLIGLGLLIYWNIKSNNAKKDEVEIKADANEPIVDNNENNEDN